jgi:hypothetical protein
MDHAWERSVVPSQTPVRYQPAQAALHRPPACNDLEARGPRIPADNLDIDALGYAASHHAGVSATVYPGLRDRGMRGRQPIKHDLAAREVLDGRRRDDHNEEHSKVLTAMCLDGLDAFPIRPLIGLRHIARRLRTLRVDDRRSIRAHRASDKSQRKAR